MQKVIISILMGFIVITGSIPMYADFNGPCPSGQTPGANGCISSSDSTNILGVPDQDLKDGNVDMNTIPLAIVSVIEILIQIAGTVAVFSLIYHAMIMQINSGITGDSSGVDKAKKGMVGSLIGFVIAIAAWFIVSRALILLSAAV